MKNLECIIFNVDHGFCSFIKSPNNYGLLIDFGSREYFSPIKWIRGSYNFGKTNINYFEGRRIAEAIITHLHLDHFSDVGSLIGVDKPKHLLRDKQTLYTIDEKIERENDTVIKNVLKAFKKFESEYTESISKDIDWGFDLFEHSQIAYGDAKELSKTENSLVNNRSFIIAVEFAEHKILFPGDIEAEGWKKYFEHSKIQEILKNTNFFIASHHGHKSGFTSEILEYTGKPDIYIVSAKSGDQHIDTSYSRKEHSNGYLVEGDAEKSRMISTRARGNSIKIVINEDGSTSISVIDTPDNLDRHQAKIRARRAKRHLENLALNGKG